MRGLPPSDCAQLTAKDGPSSGNTMRKRSGQVAQVVERSPEKAGVGGSTPSLATTILKNLAAENRPFQLTIRRLEPRFFAELSP